MGITHLWEFGREPSQCCSGADPVPALPRIGPDLQTECKSLRLRLMATFSNATCNSKSNGIEAELKITHEQLLRSGRH